jgi:hypothetical protein
VGVTSAILTRIYVISIIYRPIMAERVGFEPTVPHRGTTVFETAPIDRSGTSPSMGCLIGATTGPRNTTAEDLHQGIGWWHQIAR